MHYKQRWTKVQEALATAREERDAAVAATAR
jgi:hypothetical protein